MPRYHFHIVDGLEVFDSVGAMISDSEAARRRALELATNLGKTRLFPRLIMLHPAQAQALRLYPNGIWPPTSRRDKEMVPTLVDQI